MLLLPWLVACAAAPSDATIDTRFDPCSGLVVSAANATPAELASIDDAVDLWTGAGPFQLARGSGDGVDEWAWVEVRFEAAPRAQFGVYDDERGMIFINRGISDRRKRAITIAHELGHAFGLWHVRGVTSLMNEHNVSVGPTLLDAEQLSSAWDSCSDTQIH